MSGNFKGLLLLPLILGLALSGASVNQHYLQSAPGFALGFPRSSYETLTMAPVGSAYPYDEQVGITFTQDFSVLAFNVTAVPFTDPSGVGPGYLVNGLTELGYWYQVGLTYNWPFQFGGVNPGFNMLYEVFDSSGASIEPYNGGGLQSFNGSISAGDVVMLSLSFSSGNVTMRAMDWQTGAAASHSYLAYGSRFVGLPSRLDTTTGFFTGLMTEQDHRTPYHGAGVPVSYNEIVANLSPSWMWMDEWNTDTHQSVFSENTTSPVMFADSLSQYFSSNGTAEVANAHGLVTGLTPLTFPTLNAGPQSTGQSGRQAQVLISITDPEGGTIKFANLNISTSFGRYDLSLGTPFTFTSGTGVYNVSINVPASVSLGIYNLTIDVRSWQYLDIQAQEWIPLQQTRLNETLVLTNNPTPPTNPHSNPPSSGQGPSTSTNKTTLSPASLFGMFGSILIPLTAGYAALVLLAVALLVRQGKKRSTIGPAPALRSCQSCGFEISLGGLVCPGCGHSTQAATIPGNQESVASSPSQSNA